MTLRPMTLRRTERTMLAVSSTRIERFFSPKAALVSVGVIVACAAFGAYCVYLVAEEHCISIRGFLFAGLLLVGGFGSLARAFPRGCNACRKTPVEAASAFPTELHAHVEHAPFAGDARAVYDIARMPPPVPGQRTVVSAEMCPGCGRVGMATARVERWSGQEWTVERQGASAELLDDRALALAAALRQRGPIA
jgi:hypothetical protein